MSIPERINVLWFLPTFGDSRFLGSPEGSRPPSLDYMRQVAQAADSLGYYGVLLPTGRTCEDSWIVASALMADTRTLRFLVAVRPGLQLPSIAARMTSTLDRFSGHRLLINVVTGGDPVECRNDGIFLSHDQRYEVTRDFLSIYLPLLNGATVTSENPNYKIEEGRLENIPDPVSRPDLYFGGSSQIGQQIAGEYVDKYLTWGEPPAAVAEKIAAMRASAARFGRKMSFGIRLHVIVRPKASEAWAAAEALISRLDDAVIHKAQQILGRLDSVGQARMTALHGGSRAELEISPNLWAGVGLVRGGAGTALVGDPETVARRIDEYRQLGIDTFILSGYPHLEEAYSVAELLFPLLPLAHAAGPSERFANTGPFGARL